LHDTVKKNRKWEWMEKQKKVFKELKEKSTKEPVLVAPVMNLFLKVGSKNNSCIRKTQENSIENSSTN